MPRLRDEWTLPADVTYLNHGSFGPSPRCVQSARESWSARLERQPMQFFLRDLEPALDEVCRALGDFVGADGGDLVGVDNATAGMNIVAASVPLSPGDEVLTTDHEYGAVLRIWRRRCRQAGARLVVRELPARWESAAEIAADFLAAANERTRLIVVSHVTSPTAVVLPVGEICELARQRGIPVCIDGPHALAMRELNLRALGCDFYTASCHKWLCGPFGSGFLYVAPKWQGRLEPVLLSWGGSVSGRPPSWKDEFQWLGTRDPAPFLAVPAAIDFFRRYGLDRFRQETHELARRARQRLGEWSRLDPLVPDSLDWYGSMITLPLPGCGDLPSQPNRRDPLQQRLWDEFRIEVPIIHWRGRRFVRVSCHLYNAADDIDGLLDALRSLGDV